MAERRSYSAPIVGGLVGEAIWIYGFVHSNTTPDTAKMTPGQFIAVTAADLFVVGLAVLLNYRRNRRAAAFYEDPPNPKGSAVYPNDNNS